MRILKAGVIYFLLLFALAGSWVRSVNFGQCRGSVA